MALSEVDGWSMGENLEDITEYTMAQGAEGYDVHEVRLCRCAVCGGYWDSTSTGIMGCKCGGDGAKRTSTLRWTISRSPVVTESEGSRSRAAVSRADGSATGQAHPPRHRVQCRPALLRVRRVQPRASKGMTTDALYAQPDPSSWPRRVERSNLSQPSGKPPLHGPVLDPSRSPRGPSPDPGRSCDLRHVRPGGVSAATLHPAL